MAAHHPTLPPRNLHRTFSIPFSASENTLIKISEPNLSASGLGLETWGASHVMASILHTLPMTFPNRPNQSHPTDNEVIPILELGAGTGLVGIAAGALWKQTVVLTDLEGIVPGLRDNLLLNTELLSQKHDKHSINGGCGTLDWAEPDSLTYTIPSSLPTSIPPTTPHPTQPTKKITTTSTQGAHLILAADCIYSDEHPPLLSATILAWLSRTPDARVLLTWPLRICYLDELNELWRLLEEGGLVCLQEGKGMADGEEFADELLCEWSFWGWRDLVRRE